jgi:uncharacterized protein
MTLETLAKENLNFYAPRFEVEIGGKKLGVNISKEIIELEVTEKLDEGASFKLTLHDKFDMNTQKFRWIDDPLFDFGKKITIKIGYGSNLYTMITGKITNLEPSIFASETPPTLTIRGQDLSFEKMKTASPARTFSNVTYSDIATMIAQKTGLLSIVDPVGKFETSVSKKSDETYYEFLNKIRSRIGFVFDIKGQTMYFVKPGNDKKEILTLELGKDIASFRPTIKTTGLLAGVRVKGHNLRDPTKPIIGVAMSGSETNKEPGKVTGSELANENSNGQPMKEITDVIVNSKEHADAIAKAELLKASDTLIEGDVNCIGLPQIRTGVNIVLDKVGKRYSDKYYVIETTHTINDRGYITQFRVKSNSIKKAVI